MVAVGIGEEWSGTGDDIFPNDVLSLKKSCKHINHKHPYEPSVSAWFTFESSEDH